MGARFEVGIVSLNASGSCSMSPALGRYMKLGEKGIGELLGQRVLQGEDWRKLNFVGVCPNMGFVARRDQARGQARALPAATNGPLEDGSQGRLPPALPDALRRPLLLT